MASDMNDRLPAGRSSAAEILTSASLIQAVPLIQTILDGIPHTVVIVNRNLQIVAANRAIREMLCDPSAEFLGHRPGEAVNCIHAKQGPDGCTTSPYCAACQVLRTLTETLETLMPLRRQCRLTIQVPGSTVAKELDVTTTPLEIGGERLVACSIEDVSDRQRLSVLTQIFFHDILNVAGCIHGFVEYMHSDPAAALDPKRNLLGQLVGMTSQLLEDIRAQRDLTHAESGDLEVFAEPVETRAVLEAVRSAYAGHSVGTERKIVLADVWDGEIVTDRRLLARVLGNMLKNALEATPPGGTVTLGCVESGPQVVFSVHNASVISPEVQLQIFQRSFTTKKESGRGIGTHSIRLIGEQYLKGTVAFCSRESAGTTFTIALPRALNAEDA
jgi:signal transduction histidine kinase